jgi:MFS family permease
MDPTQDAPTPALTPFSAFESRDFCFLAASRTLATIALQMQAVAVGFQVYALTHRPITLGYVGLAQFLPVVTLSLATGHAADRFDRRGILIACHVLSAICSVAFWLIARSASPSLFAIYGTLVVLGVARAFSGPASSALLPSLIPTAHFPNAASWQSTLWQIGSIGGPSLGGLLYGLHGSAEPVYLAAAIGTAGAALLTACIRARSGHSELERRPPSLATLFAGLSYVWSSKILLGSISLDLFAVFLGGAVALLPVYATDILHVGAEGLGLLRSAPAIGSAGMAIFLAFHPLRRRVGRTMMLFVALFGVTTVVFGLSKNFLLSLAALTVLGAADMVSVVVRMTLEQAAAPPSMRGRVSAVKYVLVGASNELGDLESGVAAALLGTVPAVVVGGLGTVLVVAIWSALFPSLRDVDRFEDVKSTEP